MIFSYFFPILYNTFDVSEHDPSHTSIPAAHEHCGQTNHSYPSQKIAQNHLMHPGIEAEWSRDRVVPLMYKIARGCALRVFYVSVGVKGLVLWCRGTVRFPWWSSHCFYFAVPCHWSGTAGPPSLPQRDLCTHNIFTVPGRSSYFSLTLIIEMRHLGLLNRGTVAGAPHSSPGHFPRQDQGLPFGGFNATSQPSSPHAFSPECWILFMKMQMDFLELKGEKSVWNIVCD